MNKNNIIGIVLSILCIIHCLAVPLLALISSISFFAIFVENAKLMHVILFFPLFTLYLVTFPKNYINDKKEEIFMAASIGVLSLFLGLFLEEVLEMILTFTGASFLIFAHYKNHISTKLTKDIKV
tara:strand:+ start:103 stop:477 length:375 start_codon:yes stop_codon:yes gene_type:complete